MQSFPDLTAAARGDRRRVNREAVAYLLLCLVLWCCLAYAIWSGLN
jgi:hypothetical protein